MVSTPVLACSLFAGRVPEIGAAVGLGWQLWIRAAVWYRVGEGVALVLRGCTSLS